MLFLDWATLVRDSMRIHDCMPNRSRLRAGRWIAILVTTGAASSAADPVPPDEVTAAFRRMETNLSTSTDLPQQVHTDLSFIESVYRDLTNRLAAAEMAAARAHTRMASHIGATLCKELKKVHPSLRLVEMTRKTGRIEEIKRYQLRHQKLVEMIGRTSFEYERMIRELCTLRPEQVQLGFEDYEMQLVGMELAEQIKINHLVKQHYEECFRTGEAEVETWKKELEQL